METPKMFTLLKTFPKNFSNSAISKLYSFSNIINIMLNRYCQKETEDSIKRPSPFCLLSSVFCLLKSYSSFSRSSKALASSIIFRRT